MKKIVISLAKVMATSAIISFALMCLFSLIMLKIEVNETTLKAFVVLIYAISTFAGGFIMGKVMENKKYLWGMGCGFIYFLVILVMALVMGNEGNIASLGPVVCFVTCLAGGTIGGMAG